MILKTPIWLVHLAANQSSVMSIPIVTTNYTQLLYGILLVSANDTSAVKLEDSNNEASQIAMFSVDSNQ